MNADKFQTKWTCRCGEQPNRTNCTVFIGADSIEAAKKDGRPKVCNMNPEFEGFWSYKGTRKDIGPGTWSKGS